MRPLMRLLIHTRFVLHAYMPDLADGLGIASESWETEIVILPASNCICSSSIEID